MHIMKTFYINLFTFLFFFQIVFAQTKTYYVKYKFSLDNLEKRIMSDPDTKPFREFFLNIVKNDKSIVLELQIEGDKSYFREIKQLSISENTANLAIISGLSYKGDWLTDLNRRYQVMIKNNQGKKYYVKKPMEGRVWTLSNETKNILNFECYKAVYEAKTTKGVEYTVTAWYTKEIPLSYGPADYAGQLPGLILELHDLSSIYTATELQNVQKFKLDWPNEKKIISEESYKKEGNKVLDFYRKMN